LPNVIRKLEQAKKAEFIVRLKTILASNGYLPVIVNWICANIHEVDEVALQFVDSVNID